MDIGTATPMMPNVSPRDPAGYVVNNRPGDLIERMPRVKPNEDSDVYRMDTGTPEELQDKPLKREMVESFMHEIRHQPAWRKEADKCADYYDGNQLDAGTLAALEERGQPPLITNLIKPTIDLVLGLEVKTRTDWVVRPEDDEYCEPDLADAVSVKLKHAETESGADVACAKAYGAQIKAGLGWIEVARETDPFKPNYRVEYVHRSEIFWDWRAKDDLSNARYLIRRRWIDVEDAIAMFPQYATLLQCTIDTWSGFDPLLTQDTGLVNAMGIERDTRLDGSEWRDTLRRRVCLSEIWYRKWVKGYVMQLPNGRVVEYDKKNQLHNEAVLAGVVKVREAVFQRIRLAWYCGPHFLHDIPSPYKHREFPYVPFFGYREDLTRAPYGMIRSMVSPQDEINARKSKQLWLLNSRRVIADADAVVDHDQAADEVSRPDAYIKLNPNRRPTSKFEVQDAAALAAPQREAMMDAKAEIEQSSGIHKAMLGQSSAASSGVAINGLIDQGLTALAHINDNYTGSRRKVGEMLFSMLQEDLTHPSVVKLGFGSSERVIMLNGQEQNPETGATVKVNDVSKLRAKIVLDDVRATPTYRQQVLVQLSEIIKSLPPAGQAALAPLVVEATDLPGKQRVVERLNQALGLPDDSPQGRKAAQAKAQQQDQQQQMQFMLAMEDLKSKIEKTKAETEKTLAETEAVRAHIAGEGGDTSAMDGVIENARAQIESLQDQLDKSTQLIAQMKVQKVNDAVDLNIKNRQIDVQAQLARDLQAMKDKTAIEVAKINAAAKPKPVPVKPNGVRKAPAKGK